MIQLPVTYGSRSHACAGASRWFEDVSRDAGGTIADLIYDYAQNPVAYGKLRIRSRERRYVPGYGFTIDW